MIAGIDPFNDEDPMAIYQKILKGKVVFPKGFDKDAKSLVKHLLVADLSKRYGNLKARKLFSFRGPRREEPSILRQHKLEAALGKENTRSLHTYCQEPGRYLQLF